MSEERDREEFCRMFGEPYTPEESARHREEGNLVEFKILSVTKKDGKFTFSVLIKGYVSGFWYGSLWGAPLEEVHCINFSPGEAKSFLTDLAREYCSLRPDRLYGEDPSKFKMKSSWFKSVDGEIFSLDINHEEETDEVAEFIKARRKYE